MEKFMKKTFVTVVLLGLLYGCTSSSNADRILKSSGYTDIQLNGYAFFGCSKNDLFHDSFTAKSVNGTVVSGVVCSGIFKGSTIRLD